MSWVVVVTGREIAAVGEAARESVPAAGRRTIDLPGLTLLPGLIDAHSHLFLHPYDEAPWNDQVLKEPLAYRTIAATIHAERTLLSGFTTLRDLGTEGAGYADLSVRQAIEEGRIPGPRLQVATLAIVATASYGPGPLGFAPEFVPPKGAQEATGGAQIVQAVREQAGHGADWVKVYADYRRGPGGAAAPTFSIEELKALVDEAHSAGRPVAAHAATPEGMRRATLAGVETIEHGYGGTEEVFRLMAVFRLKSVGKWGRCPKGGGGMLESPSVTEKPLLILASNSPRRRQLLALAGWEFTVSAADVDESQRPNESPADYVLRLAETKARAIRADAEQLVLAADTAVVDGQDILGKPKDSADAIAMLKRLRGHAHQVYSGIALLRQSDKRSTPRSGSVDGLLLKDLCVTDVPMRDYSDNDILAYARTGDPLDKAGAYAIQHTGFRPVSSLSGCYASVMGLPMCHVVRMMRQLNIPPAADVPVNCQTLLVYPCPVSRAILRGEL